MLSEAAASSVIVLPHPMPVALSRHNSLKFARADRNYVFKPCHLSLEHAGVGTCDNEASALVPGLCRSRGRTVRSNACLSNKTALAMIFKLLDAAEKSWRPLDGHRQLPKLYSM
jgi:hypothetical protein